MCADKEMIVKNRMKQRETVINHVLSYVKQFSHFFLSCEKLSKKYRNDADKKNV